MQGQTTTGICAAALLIFCAVCAVLQVRQATAREVEVPILLQQDLDPQVGEAWRLWLEDSYSPEFNMRTRSLALRVMGVVTDKVAITPVQPQTYLVSPGYHFVRWKIGRVVPSDLRDEIGASNAALAQFIAGLDSYWKFHFAEAEQTFLTAVFTAALSVQQDFGGVGLKYRDFVDVAVNAGKFSEETLARRARDREAVYARIGETFAMIDVPKPTLAEPGAPFHGFVAAGWSALFLHKIQAAEGNRDGARAILRYIIDPLSERLRYQFDAGGITD